MVLVERQRTAVVGAFALSGLLLAGAGLYGLLNSIVAANTHEYAIRCALGARYANVVQSVLMSILRPSMGGVLIGCAGALWTAYGLHPLLAAFQFLDMVAALLVSISVVMLVAVAAAYFPLRRLSRVDPAVVLRS